MSEAKKGFDRVLEYVVWAGGGAFVALFYSFMVPLLVEILVGLFGLKLGALDALVNSPFAVGFIGCLGAYHFGKKNGFNEGVEWGVLNEREHQKAVATINSWRESGDSS